jgi:hypothetical protein
MHFVKIMWINQKVINHMKWYISAILLSRATSTSTNAIGHMHLFSVSLPQHGSEVNNEQEWKSVLQLGVHTRGTVKE